MARVSAAVSLLTSLGLALLFVSLALVPGSAALADSGSASPNAAQLTCLSCTECDCSHLTAATCTGNNTCAALAACPAPHDGDCCEAVSGCQVTVFCNCVNVPNNPLMLACQCN